MAAQGIHRHAGDTKERVHFNPTEADSQLQSWRHLCMVLHLCQQVTMPEPNVPKSSICRQDMCIDIHLLPEFFTHDAYAQASQHDTDFDPDMLTD